MGEEILWGFLGMAIGCVLLCVYYYWVDNRPDRVMYDRIFEAFQSDDPAMRQAAANVSRSYSAYRSASPYIDLDDITKPRGSVYSFDSCCCLKLVSAEYLGVSLLYTCVLDFGHEGDCKCGLDL